MKNYKKKLQNKLIYIAAMFILVIFTMTLMITQFKVSDYEMGFLFGLGITFGVCFLINIIRYFRLINDPQKMREEQIKEEDERNLLIEEKVQASSFTAFIIVLVVITTVYVFIDPKISMLTSCLIWVGLVVKFILTVYYRRKL